MHCLHSAAMKKAAAVRSVSLRHEEDIAGCSPLITSAWIFSSTATTHFFSRSLHYYSHKCSRMTLCAAIEFWPNTRQLSACRPAPDIQPEVSHRIILFLPKTSSSIISHPNLIVTSAQTPHPLFPLHRLSQAKLPVCTTCANAIYHILLRRTSSLSGNQLQRTKSLVLITHWDFILSIIQLCKDKSGLLSELIYLTCMFWLHVLYIVYLLFEYPHTPRQDKHFIFQHQKADPMSGMLWSSHLIGQAPKCICYGGSKSCPRWRKLSYRQD
jgi:hypothetical protein